MNISFKRPPWSWTITFVIVASIIGYFLITKKEPTSEMVMIAIIVICVILLGWLAWLFLLSNKKK